MRVQIEVLWSKRDTFRAWKVGIVTSIGESPPSHSSSPLARTYL